MGQNLSFLVKKWRFFEKFFFKSSYLASRCSERVACGRWYCWALRKESVDKFSFRSDENWLSYNIFRNAFFRKFLESQSISAVFCPDFFPGPLLKTSPGRFTSQKNHLALNTEFQRSRIPRVKDKWLRIFSKIFQKFFFQLQASQSQETSTQLVLQVNACGKCSNRREKWAIIKFCSLTWRWLMTILVWACYVRKNFKNWKSKLSLIQNSSEYAQSIPERFNSSYIVQQHHSRSFDSFL